MFEEKTKILREKRKLIPFDGYGYNDPKDVKGFRKEVRELQNDIRQEMNTLILNNPEVQKYLDLQKELENINNLNKFNFSK